MRPRSMAATSRGLRELSVMIDVQGWNLGGSEVHSVSGYI